MQFENTAALKKYQKKALVPTRWFPATPDMESLFRDAIYDAQWPRGNMGRLSRNPVELPMGYGRAARQLCTQFFQRAIDIKSVQTVSEPQVKVIRFSHPVNADAHLRIQTTLMQCQDDSENGTRITLGFVVEILGAEHPACVAQFRVLVRE